MLFLCLVVFKTFFIFQFTQQCCCLTASAEIETDPKCVGFLQPQKDVKKMRKKMLFSRRLITSKAATWAGWLG